MNCSSRVASIVAVLAFTVTARDAKPDKVAVQPTFRPDLAPYIGSGSPQNCSSPCEQCPRVTIEVGVRNWTGSPTTATDPITIKLEGAHSYTKTVDGFMPHGSVSLGQFSYPWPCPRKGHQSLPQAPPPNHRITVDTTNAVAESDETNNGRDFHMPPDATFTP